ncbi:MAG: OB-fold nucleic acid binding domain-containing protein [Myxococcaceae bacterium]
MNSPNSESKASSESHESSPEGAPQEAMHEEAVRKVYARDVREKQSVHTVFRVGSKQKQTARSGRSFVTLALLDRTGSLDARIFDRVDELEARFQTGDYVLVRGDVATFHGKLQLIATDIERLDPEPIDAAEFTPTADTTTGREDKTAADAPTLEPLREALGDIEEPSLRTLVTQVLGDNEATSRLGSAPARIRGAHSKRGELLRELVLVMKRADRLCEAAGADSDVVGVGILFSGLGVAFAFERSGGLSESARLLGAPHLAASTLRGHIIRAHGVPRALEHQLTHVVLAATPSVDGEPRLTPRTREAVVAQAAFALEGELTGVTSSRRRRRRGEKASSPTPVETKPTLSFPPLAQIAPPPSASVSANTGERDSAS